MNNLQERCTRMTVYFYTANSSSESKSLTRRNRIFDTFVQSKPPCLFHVSKLCPVQPLVDVTEVSNQTFGREHEIFATTCVFAQRNIFPSKQYALFQQRMDSSKSKALTPKNDILL